MKLPIIRLLFLIYALSFSVASSAHNFDGVWILKIQNQTHQEMTTLNIQFTKQKAQSCIGGNWLQARVLSYTTKDKSFFPISEPLSYSIEKNQLTIGITEICDGYLMLSGLIKNKMMSGKYYSLGTQGTSPLGFFTLSKIIKDE